MAVGGGNGMVAGAGDCGGRLFGLVFLGAEAVEGPRAVGGVSGNPALQGQWCCASRSRSRIHLSWESERGSWVGSVSVVV